MSLEQRRQALESRKNAYGLGGRSRCCRYWLGAEIKKDSSGGMGASKGVLKEVGGRLVPDVREIKGR
jgi:hypothetical protein